MSQAKIEIIGSLIACSEGIRDDWRQIANWLEEKMTAQYGGQIEVRYYDLFDESKPELPDNAKLPVLMINRTVISQGGKISIPEINKHLKSLGF